MVGTADEYSCEDVEHLLDDFLDGELSRAQIERVERHLANCAPCAGGRSFEADVLGQLKDHLRAIKAPMRLVDRVEKAMREVRDTEEVGPDTGADLRPWKLRRGDGSAGA